MPALCRDVVCGGALLVPGNSCGKLEVLSVAGLKEWEFLQMSLPGMLDRIKVYKMSCFKSKASDISADTRARKTPQISFSVAC